MSRPTTYTHVKAPIVEKFNTANALNVGDAVFLSATGSVVNKSATALDYAARVGIVVGGSSLYGEIAQETGDVGKQAAAANGWVWVVVYGPALAVSEGGSTAGAKLLAGTVTAGRVKTGTTAGQVIGYALDTVLTTATFWMFVRPE